MESKICTYTEPNHRLQLLRVCDDKFDGLELRYNRKCIVMFSKNEAYHARLYFSHLVSIICINRESPLSFLA